MIGLFAEFKDGSIFLHEEKPIRTMDKFPPSCIEFRMYTDNEIRAVNFEPKVTVSIDKELDSLIDKVISKESEIKDIKGSFSYGTCLIGASGSGKTTQLKAAAKKLRDEHQAICFFTNAQTDLFNGMEVARRIDDPEQLYAFFIDGFSEDFTEELKNLLDGYETIQRVLVFIAEESMDDIAEPLRRVSSRITSYVELHVDEASSNKIADLIGSGKRNSKNKIGFGK